MMQTVRALTGFDHHGLRRAGDVFAVSQTAAAELVAAGLCAAVEPPETPPAPPAPPAPPEAVKPKPRKPKG